MNDKPNATTVWHSKVNVGVVMICLLNLLWNVSAFGQGTAEEWQTSSTVFVRELVLETGGEAENKTPKLVERFGSKQITWEGTVKTPFPADGLSCCRFG